MTTGQEQVAIHRLSVVARGCHGDLTNNELLTALVRQAAGASCLSVVGEAVHAFVPHGLSIALLLAQSHLVLSTWPEYQTVVLDLMVCADSGAAFAVWQEIRKYVLPMTFETSEQSVVIPPTKDR
ncbi:MAG: S-adenosylmethionine decarboxylase [Acidobacteriota bacterium]|nr:S-adenosylmethionine decarboxylase [Acidobacteriota bacterium]